MARGRRGSGKPKVVVSYEDAPDDVKAILKKLIEESHGFLAQAEIGALSRHGKWSHRGETVMAAIKRPGPENRHYHELDYILTINSDFWNAVPAHTKEAIIDEQLCLCNINDNTGKFGIQAPDVTANNRNVCRYGAWKHSLLAMEKALKEGAAPKKTQMELPVDEATATMEDIVIMSAEDNDGDTDHGQGDDSNPWDENDLQPAVNA